MAEVWLSQYHRSPWTSGNVEVLSSHRDVSMAEAMTEKGWLGSQTDDAGKAEGWRSRAQYASRASAQARVEDEKKVDHNLTKMWTMQSVRSPIFQHSASGPLRLHNTGGCLILCSSPHIPCPYVPCFTHQCTSLQSDFCPREITDYIAAPFWIRLKLSAYATPCISMYLWLCMVC